MFKSIIKKVEQVSTEKTEIQDDLYTSWSMCDTVQTIFTKMTITHLKQLGCSLTYVHCIAPAV